MESATSIATLTGHIYEPLIKTASQVPTNSANIYFHLNNYEVGLPKILHQGAECSTWATSVFIKDGIHATQSTSTTCTIIHD